MGCQKLHILNERYKSTSPNYSEGGEHSPSFGGGLVEVIERLVYGTDDNENNIGQIIESYAQDGKTSFEYDFKGNVIKQHKQFANTYDTQLDWNTQVNLLEEVFITETTYDALNRPVTVILPENTQQTGLIITPPGFPPPPPANTHLKYSYDKGGLLVNVLRNNTDEHISDIEYNEKGQRLNIYYGNNTKTKYEYNSLNFRLIRILTTRNTGQDILQDLNYEYDAVGNITKITDDAQQTHYFNNKVIEPVSTFEYDALYRIICATGRELTALAAPTPEDFANDIYCPNPAANAMQNFKHFYQYDALGNMLSDHWKDYIYDTETNRLLKHDIQQSFDDYKYDEHGNMLTMPHIKNYWDKKDRLFSAGNSTFINYNNYDAQGNRTRKVVEKGNIIETRYYINGYELFRKEVNGSLETERTTINVADDEKVFVRIETETGQSEVIRYQYDNHLGSACLELDETGQIISYEEYHPFGTTSYRSGRTYVEVSLKRYKYCGKERDEETGLYYYGMRFYAAWICRFVSVDPLQFEYPELTPFQYSNNNPVTMIDLDGAEGVKPEDLQVREGFQVNTKTTEYTENGNMFRRVESSAQYGLQVTSEGLDLKYISISSLQELYQLSASTDTWDLVSSILTETSYLEINNVETQSSVLPYVEFGLNLGSAGATLATTIGDLSGKLDLFKQGKFLANYNGVEKTWKLGWLGNQSVSKSFAIAEQAKFVNNLKVLEGVKWGGRALGGASAVISTIQIFTDSSSNRVEHGMDAAMSLVGIFGGIPGASASAYYSFFAKPLYPVMAKEVKKEANRRADAMQRGSWGEVTVRPGRK